MRGGGGGGAGGSGGSGVAEAGADLVPPCFSEAEAEAAPAEAEAGVVVGGAGAEAAEPEAAVRPPRSVSEAAADDEVAAPADADAATRKDLTRLTSAWPIARARRLRGDRRRGERRSWTNLAKPTVRLDPRRRRAVGGPRFSTARATTDDNQSSVGSLRVAMDAAAWAAARARRSEGAIPMSAAFAFKRGRCFVGARRGRAVRDELDLPCLDDSGEAEPGLDRTRQPVAP